MEHQDYSSLILRGEEAFRSGRYEEAVEAFKEAINLEPDVGEAHYNLAMAYEELSRLEEAAASYEEALRLKPENRDAHYSLMSVYDDLGRKDDARAMFVAASEGKFGTPEHLFRKEFGDKEDYSRLQELIKQDKVLIQVSKKYSGAALGGRLGCFFFNLILLSSLVGLTFFIVKGLYLYALFVVVGFVIFFVFWSKAAFYYSYVRSIRSFDYFNSAYVSGIIQLRTKEGGLTLSFPEPWKHILEVFN